jgi:putative CocE/NonD family hydrolase
MTIIKISEEASMLSFFSSRKIRSRLQHVSVVFLAAFLIAAALPAQEAERVSKFGEYKGYSEDVYDSWVRTSQYLTMRDGIKIAIDIIRPAMNGEVAEEPLPVIWSHNRYRRAHIQNGKLISSADSPLTQSLIKHGYIIANADSRGSGASFGTWEGLWTRKETQDAYEITEWLAAQPWCDGNVGMVGGSYLGITQLMAAGTKPPHLKAIFPAVALLDMYAVSYPGGVFYDDLVRTWSELTKVLDTQAIAAPVDADKDQALLKAAIEQHKQNRSLIDIFLPLKYRDSVDEATGVQPFYQWHPAAYIEEINQSGIPIYLWCGWFDSFTRDGFLMYRNFKNPGKITIGAWSHSPKDPDIIKDEFEPAVVEEIRWFDYWLKGIGNGIMDEPPIRYHVMRAPKDNEWRTAEQWPIPEVTPTRFYFHEGPTGSVNSINDGVLSSAALPDGSGKDVYEVDYSTTTGTTTRWDNAVGGGFGYPDMTANDEKGLTYTTPPLTEDLEITGHPVCHIWISSTATDGDFFAYLEEVDADGISHYVTEGAIKASHRALHEPYYDKMGLPFHRSHEEDVVSLTPGEPVELVFDLQPTSNIFNAGNLMRITIVCADKDNALTEELSPPPTVTIYRDQDHASHVVLPVMGQEAIPEADLGALPTQKEEFPPLAILFVALGIIILVIFLTAYVRKRIGSKK